MAKEPSILKVLREASQGLQQVLGILAERGPLALQPALRRLAQDLSRHHDLALALEGSRRRLADPIWDDVAASLLLSQSRRAWP